MSKLPMLLATLALDLRFSQPLPCHKTEYAADMQSWGSSHVQQPHAPPEHKPPRGQTPQKPSQLLPLLPALQRQGPGDQCTGWVSCPFRGYSYDAYIRCSNTHSGTEMNIQLVSIVHSQLST